MTTSIINASITTAAPLEANTEAFASRQQLMALFAGVAEQFAQAKLTVTEQELQLNAGLQQLDGALQQAMASGKANGLSADHPLQQHFNGLLAQCADTQQQWLSQVQQHEKGTEFREQLGDSLLVFVYGKVKAGKSSLSNYIAAGASQPTPAQMQAAYQQGLQLAQAEASGMNTDQGDFRQGFSVDRQECTDAIQYFTLPGLTWVDSPGLHSKNPANGELSRQYARSADLIIYMMSAANPGRGSDLQEVAELLQLNKPLLVLITGCDEIELDEDEQGQLSKRQVMYSQEKRDQQVAFVQQQLAEVCAHNPAHRELLRSAVLPVSVHMAERAQTHAEFADSGMQQLLSQLQQIAAGESVQLKQQTPRNNLTAFCQRLTLSVAQLDQQVGALNQACASFKQQVQQQEPVLVSQLQYHLHHCLQQQMRNYSGNNQALSQAMNKALQQHLGSLIDQALTKQLGDLSTAVDQALRFNPDVTLPGFSARFEKCSIPVTHHGRKTLSRLAGGLGGALLGFFVGGPAGALVGGSAGLAAGDSLSGSAQSTREVSIPDGDNRDEIMAAAQQLFDEQARRAVALCYGQPLLSALATLQHSAQHSKQALAEFQRCLAQL
ncbi:hypothetical protein CBP31_13030 [Oceanisphaera profunda]|uniref:Dynamin N-terminal domain-containing protein n=1 Tax=Oceanisphaera profunda TaxID=1416627 RepID=A0A1Y0D7D3_9GAMM|nr:dynamin family protein [Oceanisphaera profunda]ART83430.1 hypothetical protein CBP31_13030 [Oceanisphaera profunda]